MSFQDDYEDLESRLRQNKPETEPLSPALKGQMRQALMEQMTMNENRFTFRKLSMALGGLLLLIGVPLFFWMAQMSAGNTLRPGNEGPTAVPTQSTILDPARPTVASVGEEVEVPVVEIETDKVWLVSADVAQGETINRNGTINVVFGYVLQTVEEANLIVKLVDGPRGVLTVEQPVSGVEGSVEVALPLSELEEVSGDSVTLELNIILEDPTNPSDRLLYLDFVEGWAIDLTASPTVNAEIINIGQPTLAELDGPAAQPVYEVELLTAYEVAGYDNAVLVVGYQYQGANGGASGGHEITPIQPGRGELPVTMLLDGELFDAAGEVIEGVEFFVRINSYDQTTGKWLNIFPGNALLTASEETLPFPYHRDVLYVQSTGWDEDASGQLFLNVTIGYNLLSQETAEIRVDVTGLGEAMLASDGAAIEEGEGSLTIPVAVDRAQVEANGMVQVTAVLTTDEFELVDTQSAVYATQAQEASTQDNVWIISTNVITTTSENGVKADITLVVGYDLSSEYTSGSIRFGSSYQGSGGGGGGGSSTPITPGTGTTEFVFGFETTSWATAKEWLDSMSSHLELLGYTVDGAEVLIGEVFKTGTD